MAGGAALLAYRMTSPGVMNMTSTFVPPSGRGKGTGARLVEAALNYARDNNLQVIPSCWYVADYIDAHPEYAPLLDKGNARKGHDRRELRNRLTIPHPGSSAIRLLGSSAEGGCFGS
jgi:predicted GNAT family acetyltransferase